ncbi:hypothetical protein [Herpetosiphon geysericola]|uniref:Uncharacterized protein n=1 Tax=Herpetosiphon geysericola TaxID=70996 RepID=A0A0N8GT81_9CHLR|nr:hypothetical protein [Herpetosiphon geysericola]KPL91362.1 hypothetical protein SE18_02790 [Herpetosiphon geysericola]
MTYLYILIVCLILGGFLLSRLRLARRAPVTLQTHEQFSTGAQSVEQLLAEWLDQSFSSQNVRNVVVQAIASLNDNQIFSFAFICDSGLCLGFIERTFDAKGQETSKHCPLINLWTEVPEAPIAQFKLPEQDQYAVYGYMPNDFDQMAKIYLANGEVFYFEAHSGLQVRVLPLTNPALKVQIIDTNEGMINEYGLPPQ